MATEGGSDLTEGEIASIYGSAQSTGPEIDAATSSHLDRCFGGRVSLLPHQRRAVAWMVEREANGGGVLADEPGLGKTLSVLALVATDWARGKQGPTLVVAPTYAVREQWASEAKRFWGDTRTVARYDGPPRDAGAAWAEVERLKGADLVLCDLSTLRCELHFRSAEVSGRRTAGEFVAVLFHAGNGPDGEWRRLVVDEVQDILVSKSSAAAQVAQSLLSNRRWGVSGTPVSSKGLDGLQSLFGFIHAEPYDDPDWWIANVKLPLKTTARPEALTIAKKAAAEWLWRSSREDAAPIQEPAQKKAKKEYYIKSQNHLATVVVCPGAAELAATRPAQASLVRQALDSARLAGMADDATELSTREAQQLLSGGKAGRKTASFLSLCRSATAVGLGSKDYSSKIIEEEVDEKLVRCEDCSKWRPIPPDLVLKGRWTCADSKGWSESFKCRDPEVKDSALGRSSNLGVVLQKVAARAKNKAGATLLALAAQTASRAAAQQLPGQPNAGVAAMLLDAWSMLHNGRTQDEPTAIRWMSPKEQPPLTLVAAIAERLEAEHRALLSKPQQQTLTLTEESCFGAVRYLRASRRIATAMSSSPRLGRGSPARRVPDQVWERIWEFVDGGAGDLVADVLAKAQQHGWRSDARDRADIARRELLEASSAVVIEEEDVEALRDVIVGALHWADPPATAAAKQTVLAARRAGQEVLPFFDALVGRPAGRTLKPALFHADDGEAVKNENEVTGLMNRGCRAMRQIRELVARMGDPGCNDQYGAHETTLGTLARDWCGGQAQTSAEAVGIATEAIAEEICRLLRLVCAEKEPAVRVCSELIEKVQQGAFDAVDKKIAERPAKTVLKEQGDSRTPPTCPMPGLLMQHVKCRACRLQAWRVLSNLRRAHLTWPDTLTLCKLCVARKTSTLARAFLSTKDSQKTALMRFIEAACCFSSVPSPAARITRAVSRLREDLTAAAHGSRAADDVALASLNFRRGTIDALSASTSAVRWESQVESPALMSPTALSAQKMLEKRIFFSGGLTPLARLSTLIAQSDEHLLELRAQLQIAQHDGNYARSISSVRGELRGEGSSACSVCSLEIVSTEKRRLGARIGPCSHVVCGDCLEGPAGTEESCRACNEALPSGSLWCEQALADARQLHCHRRGGDFGAKIERVADDVKSLVFLKEKKCLVFSQWTDALELLGISLAQRGVDSVKLTGGRGAPALLEKFRRGTATALLMPLKTNNAGLNLSEATHVFLLDTGLAPALEVQALARVRRLDSPCDTLVHRYITRDSVENAIWQLRRSKAQTEDITVTESLTRKDVHDMLATMLGQEAEEEEEEEDVLQRELEWWDDPPRTKRT